MTMNVNIGKGGKLWFIGPMTGANHGRVTSQGEWLAELFTRDGCDVISVSRAANRYVRFLDIIWSLVRFGRKNDIQVLQVYTGLSFVVEDIASFVGKLLGQRVIMHLHGGNLPAFISRFPKWSRRVLARADALIAPSGYLVRAVAEIGYCCSVVPNVLETESYPYRKRSALKPRFLWMRAFQAEIYNPLMAIRVFARVMQSVPEASLVMAGQFHHTQGEVERLAVELGVGQAVRFAGFLDKAGKIREGQNADVFLNTNYIDNTPVSILEAFAMGLPVVATNVGGISDLIVSEENGLLVPVDADGAMAEAILRLLRDPALSERLSENGRKYAERCSWVPVRLCFEGVFQMIDRVQTNPHLEEYS